MLKFRVPAYATHPDLHLPCLLGRPWQRRHVDGHNYVVGLMDSKHPSGTAEPEVVLVGIRWDGNDYMPTRVEVIHSHEIPWSIVSTYDGIDGIRNAANKSQARELLERAQILVQAPAARVTTETVVHAAPA